jgi:O-antigen ligase
MEGGWLAALAVAVLFFNPYSANIFEPDKSALVRSIALVIAGAGVVLWLEERQGAFDLRASLKRLASFPLALPVFALAASYLLASALSINRWDSLLGSYVRLQGMFSLLAYVAVFAAAAATVRRPAQFERVLAMASTVGLAAALYALMQRFGLDWIEWGDKSRLTATFGNPNFLAELLAMTLPLTASGLLRSLASPSARTAMYGLAAGVEAFAVLLSNARGGLLGFLAGLLVWGLIVAISRGWRRLSAGLLGGAALAGLLLALLNLPSGPLEPLRRLPALDRVSHVLASQSDSSYERELLWDGTAQLMLPHAPLRYPDGHGDGLNALRPLLGYGPETMVDAFQPFSPAALLKIQANTNWDRPHNEVLNAWEAAGIPGALSYLWLFGAAFVLAAGQLVRLSRRTLAICVVAAVVIALDLAVVALRLKGLGYIGVALPMGILLAFGGLLALVAIRPAVAPVAPYDPAGTPLLAATAGAVAAHFTAMQFGIATTPTWLLLWLCLGLLAAGARWPSPQPAPEAGAGAWLAPASIGAVPLLVLIVDFLRNDGSTGIPQTLVLLAAVAIPLAVLLAPPGLRLKALGGSALFGACFAVYQLASLSLGVSRPTEMGQLLQSVLLRGSFFNGLAIAILVLLALRAGPGLLSSAGAFAARPQATGIAAVAAAVAVLVGAFWSVQQIRADMIYHAGAAYETPGQYQVAARLYEEASSIAPHQDVFRLSQGQVLVQAAGEAPSWDEQRPLMVRAADELGIAFDIRPLNSVNIANLAKVEHRWAEMTLDPAEARDAATAAARNYASAVATAPGDGALWADRARFELGPHHSYLEGLQALTRAIAFAPAPPEPFKEITLGWVGLSSGAPDEARARADLAAAIESFKAAQLPPELAAAQAQVLAAAGPAVQVWDAASAAYAPLPPLLKPGEARAARWLALSEAYAQAGNQPLAQMAAGGDVTLDTRALCGRLRSAGAPLRCLAAS